MPKKRPSHHSFFVPIFVLGLILVGAYFWYWHPLTTQVGINFIGTESGTVSLTFDPGALSLNPGSTTTLDLTINAGDSHVSGAQIELTYDSAKFAPPSVALGSFLPNVLVPVKVASGKITFTVVAPPDSGGKTGVGTLAMITLKPSAVGSSSLSFGDSNAVYVVGSQTNAIKVASDASLTVSPATPETPSKPTGLRSTCTTDGKEITLRWDAVSGADSYKIHAYQTDGNDDQSTSDIVGTEHQLTINPGHPYAWWVKTTKAGVDSEEAGISSVTCPASSPTPTPVSTAKPTTKPTAKPTIKPTVTLSTSSEPISPRPDPSLIPLPSTATFGSLNDIFKNKDLVTDTPKLATTKPNFFQMLALGWQAIFAQLASLFH